MGQVHEQNYVDVNKSSARDSTGQPMGSAFQQLKLTTETHLD